jgi:hypothetical protein
VVKQVLGFGLLEKFEIRRPYDMSNRIGGRRPPKDLGELRFEEWLYILGLSPEEEDDRKLKAAVMAEKQYRAGTGKKKIGGADCQEDQLSPSFRKALGGYIRISFYADTPAGKRRAQQKKKQLAREYEGELNIRVYRVYCKDSRQWGWSVWVRQVAFMEKKYATFSTDEEGNRVVRVETYDDTFKAPRGGDEFGSHGNVRSWTAYRSAAKKKVSCPKCDAPKDFPCVNDRGIEEGIYEEDGKPMTAEQAEKYKAGRGLVKEVRVRRTNPHRERVDKYLFEKEGLVENPNTAFEGDFVKAADRVEPDDGMKRKWILNTLNEGQYERLEDLEEEKGRLATGVEMEILLNKKQYDKYKRWRDFGVLKEE